MSKDKEKNRGKKEMSTLHGFEELAASFNVELPKEEVVENPWIQFINLSPLEKCKEVLNLRYERGTKSGLIREISFAIKSVMDMSTEERKNQGLELIVNGPSDERGKLKPDLPLDIFAYFVYVKLNLASGKTHYISNSCAPVADNIKEENESNGDALIKFTNNIIELAECYPETPEQQYMRYISTLRYLDYLISKEKHFREVGSETGLIAGKNREISFRRTTGRSNELNQWKTIVLARYLDLAKTLQSKFGELFKTSESYDNVHTNLSMVNIPEGLNKNEPTKSDKSKSIVVGLEPIKMNARFFREGKLINEYTEACNNICNILGL